MTAQTSQELDALLAARRARAEVLRQELSFGYIAALEDPEQMKRAIVAKAELEAIPTQIGELTRRRVLARLAELRAAAEELRPDWEALDAAHTEYHEAFVAWQNERLKQIPATMDAYQRRGHELSDAYRPQAVVWETCKLKMQMFYVWAANEYGVGLDGSDFERWATGKRNNYPLRHDEAAWNEAAQRAGQEAARKLLL
jgi:hypothetical protein